MSKNKWCKDERAKKEEKTWNNSGNLTVMREHSETLGVNVM